MSTIARESKPLTTREKALLAHLLSDPFSYPLTFKTWHVRSLELSDLTLLMSNVSGLTKTLGLENGGTGAVSLLPTGSVVLFAGAATPSGSLLCDGAVYTVAAYPELHDVIGYVYGGAGPTFQVPNLVAPGVGLKYVIVT